MAIAIIALEKKAGFLLFLLMLLDKFTLIKNFLKLFEIRTRSNYAFLGVGAVFAF